MLFRECLPLKLVSPTCFRLDLYRVCNNLSPSASELRSSQELKRGPGLVTDGSCCLCTGSVSVLALANFLPGFGTGENIGRFEQSLKSFVQSFLQIFD